MKYKISEYTNVVPGYLDNSIEKPFYHTELGKGLEGITLQPIPEKRTGTLERVFSDKTKTLKETVKALLKEIELRENINSHLLQRIDEGISRQHTDLMQLDNMKTNYSPETRDIVSKRKTILENNVLDLEKEKRSEYLECWRDLMFMKKYLLSSLKDYWNLVKKKEVLSLDSSELIQNETGKRY